MINQKATKVINQIRADISALAKWRPGNPPPAHVTIRRDMYDTLASAIRAEVERAKGGKVAWLGGLTESGGGIVPRWENRAEAVLA